MDCECVIEDLIKSYFDSKQFGKKVEIIRQRQPCPILPNLSFQYRDKNHSYTSYFTESNYGKTQWLIGCQHLNKCFASHAYCLA